VLGAPGAGSPSEYDNRSYECVAGDNLRQANTVEVPQGLPGNVIYQFNYDFDSTGATGVAPAVVSEGQGPQNNINPNMVDAGNSYGVSYSSTAAGWQDGQVVLYCDPAASTP
jgi:hypothetical protein